MNKKIKDYIHLYPGCTFTTESCRTVLIGSYSIPEGTIAIYMIDKLGQPLGWWVENCDLKLVLRPLASMTEKESKQYRSLIKTRPAFGTQSDFWERESWDLNQSATLTTWCRNKGFDVDGLIESGLAIIK